MRLIDGKRQLYMTIDGIKVHETDPEKQPPPPVVHPGQVVPAPLPAVGRRGLHRHPLAVVDALLSKEGIDDPELLRTRFEAPTTPCICSTWVG